MAFTFVDVQRNDQGQSSSALVLPAFASDPQDGDSIVVVYADWSGLVTVRTHSTPTDTEGNLYVQIGTTLSAESDQRKLSIWLASGIVGGSAFAVTCQSSAATYKDATVMCLRNRLVSNADFTSNVTTGSNPTSGTSSPAPPASALFIGGLTRLGAGASDGSGWNTEGANGFTAGMHGRMSQGSDTNVDLDTEYQISAAALSADWTAASNVYAAFVTSFADAPITPAAGALTLTGRTPTLGLAIGVAVGALALSGLAPAVFNGVISTPAAGALTLVGRTPALTLRTTVAAGALALTGQPVTIDVSRVVLPSPGALAFTGPAPLVGLSLGSDQDVAVPHGRVALDGPPPSPVVTIGNRTHRSRRAMVPNIWFELRVPQYPPEFGVVLYRWGFEPWSSPNRRIDGRLKSCSAFTRSVGSSDFDPQSASMSVLLTDRDGFIRSLLAADSPGQFIDGAEATLYLLSEEGRHKGLLPLLLFRGVVSGDSIQISGDHREVSITCADLVGSTFSGFNLDKKFCQVPVGSEHTGLPAQKTPQFYPIVYGEHTDLGTASAGGADAQKGKLPFAIDTGNYLLDGSTGDPSGRTFNTSLGVVTSQAIVNDAQNGNITTTTFGKVAPIYGGVIGQPSTTLVLDPFGNGQGGPAIPHGHFGVFDDAAGSPDEYIYWFFQNPLFDPISNPAGDPTVRYKIVPGPSNPPAWPLKVDGSSWDHGVNFASLTDGAPWGMQTAGPPTNVTATIVGTAGTTTYRYALATGTPFGESMPGATVVITNGPAVLSATDYIVLSWDPPADNADQVTYYRLLGRTASPASLSLAIVHNPGAFTNPPPTTFTDTGAAVPSFFDRSTSPAAPADPNAWGRFVVAIGHVDIHTLFGSDEAEQGEPKRIALDPDGGKILLPTSLDWPHPNPWITLTGPDGQDIDMTVFYARGTILTHHRAGTVTFAWNGCGYTDANGLLINQVARVVPHAINEHLLRNDGAGYRSGDWAPIQTFANGDPMIQTSRWAALEAFFVARLGGIGYRIAVAIGPDQITVREFVRRCGFTFEFWTTTNHWGQIIPVWVDTADLTTGRYYRERYNLTRLGAQKFAHDRVETSCSYSWNYDYDAAKFLFTAVPYADDAATAAHRQNKHTQEHELWYAGDAATAQDSRVRRIARLKRAPRTVDAGSDLGAVHDELGAQVRLQHPDGIGVGGDVATALLVVAQTVDPTALAVTLTGLDLVRIATPI